MSQGTEEKAARELLEWVLLLTELECKRRICSAGGVLLQRPKELFCPLPSVVGRVPATAGEGVFLGDKVKQLELSFSLLVSENTWIMLIGFSQQFPLGLEFWGERDALVCFGF